MSNRNGYGPEEPVDSRRWAEIVAALQAAKRVVVATHIHPDGDALGSQMALVRILQIRGLEAVPVLAEAVPANLCFLDPGEEVRVAGDPRVEEMVARADWIAVLDVSRSDRLGRLMNPVLASAARRLCIDHHLDGDFPAHLSVIDGAASSTGELIYELARELLPDRPLPLAVALPLYVAVLTDTGGFRFGNTQPRVHRLAAEFLASGVSPTEVHRQVYERTKAETLRLLGMALSDLKTDENGRLAWIDITQDQLRRSGARQEDVDGFVDLPRTVGGVELVALFMELASGKVKVSLRSREPINVQRLAARFGGGGHPQAAGILMDGPWQRSRDAVLDAARGAVREAHP